MMYTEGNFWLVMEGVEPEKMLPQGMGYWSPLLGAAPGAKITVSLKMRGKDLVSSEKGSPAVWLQFTNETGQNRQRVFLVGKDDAGKMHGGELTNGSYDWTEVKQTIIAPEGAVRMALFLGLLPCKGQVNFDDINISTASERQGRFPRTFFCPACRFSDSRRPCRSISPSRPTASFPDEIGGGQAGFATRRRRRLGGVMFDLLPDEGNAVIAIASANRPEAGLPEQVTIPVGKKLDTLFFLHAADRCPAGGDEAFHYVVHYADGKDVALQVTGNNLVDWNKDPVARFPLEEDTFTTVVETVKNKQFRQGSLYRMEWSAPLDRRGVEIKSIDFVGGGKAAPMLLGITGVVIWN